MRDKSGIGGFFSSLIYDEPADGKATKEAPQAAVPVVAQTAPVVATPASTGRIPTVTATTTTTVATPQIQTEIAKVNEEMHQGLIKLIEDNNLDGFDYLEFMDSVQKMSAVALPEAEKYKLVFTTAQSFGVTVDTLTNAVDHYVKVLNNHKTEFEGHVNNQVGSEIEQRKQRVIDLDKETESLNAQIAEISQKIASNTTESATINQEVTQQELKIRMVAQDFTATFEHVTNRLQSDKQKIHSYLGA